MKRSEIRDQPPRRALRFMRATRPAGPAAPRVIRTPPESGSHASLALFP